jgi:hypothetical protein
MAKRTLPKWKISARTAGIDSATDIILEAKLTNPENIKEETMRRVQSAFTATSTSTSASYYYHQTSSTSGKYLEKKYQVP